MKNSKKEFALSLCILALAFAIIIGLFIYDSMQPKLRANLKYKQLFSAQPSISAEVPGRYDVTRYIDGQPYNADGDLLVYTTPSGEKYHLFAACVYLKGANYKIITQTDALLLQRSICSNCAKERE